MAPRKAKGVASADAPVEGSDANNAVTGDKRASDEPDSPNKRQTKETIQSLSSKRKASAATDDDPGASSASRSPKTPKSAGKRQKKEDEDEDAEDGESEATPPSTLKRSVSSLLAARMPDDMAAMLASPTVPPGAWKVVSYNANSLNASFQKKLAGYLTAENADIYCLQETKSDAAAAESLPWGALGLVYPYRYWACPVTKKGYAGTGVISKHKPLAVTYGIGDLEHDQEGRVITLEFDGFFLVNAYVPNSGTARLEYRQGWDVALRGFVAGLDKRKPVVLTGDLNVAHEPIDLARPKTNTKTAGFTKEEREGMTALLAAGFVDVHRAQNPGLAEQYTYYSYRFSCYDKNLGWRLDYFIASERFASRLTDSFIRRSIYGASDHVPLGVLIHV